MKIKTGDTVIVISGDDKGKVGKVLRALPATEQVIVEGVNVCKKHVSSVFIDQRSSVPSAFIEHSVEKP